MEVGLNKSSRGRSQKSLMHSVALCVVANAKNMAFKTICHPFTSLPVVNNNKLFFMLTIILIFVSDFGKGVERMKKNISLMIVVAVFIALVQAVTAADALQYQNLVAFECETKCEEVHSACWKKCLEGPIEENQSCHDACNEAYRKCISDCLEAYNTWQTYSWEEMCALMKEPLTFSCKSFHLPARGD